MASSYRGLYKCLPKQPRPDYIQIQDTGGNELPLPIDDYEARGVRPDWRTLPWQGEGGVDVSGLEEEAKRGEQSLPRNWRKD